MRLELEQLDWRIVNDGVMGGLSKSRLDIHDDHLCFRGELSTENRGGFVSVLGRLEQPLSDLTGFELVVSGDGRRYQLRLRESESARDVAWRAYFNTRNRQSRVGIELDEFNPVMRGQPAIGARPLALTPVRYLGFMLTSRRPGPFELKIHSLEALFLKQAGEAN
jgi:monofunctional biosynthetic peptidoglycan transglycosylase